MLSISCAMKWSLSASCRALSASCVARSALLDTCCSRRVWRFSKAVTEARSLPVGERERLWNYWSKSVKLSGLTNLNKLDLRSGHCSDTRGRPMSDNGRLSTKIMMMTWNKNFVPRFTQNTLVEGEVEVWNFAQFKLMWRKSGESYIILQKLQACMTLQSYCCKGLSSGFQFQFVDPWKVNFMYFCYSFQKDS